MKYQITTDNKTEAKQMLQAADAFGILWSVSERLRSLYKHGDLQDTELKLVEDLRDYLFSELDTAGINLYEDFV